MAPKDPHPLAPHLTREEVGRRGGAARAKALTRDERVRIASSGGKAVWKRIKAGELPYPAAGIRTCSFCHRAGHNRATCPDLGKTRGGWEYVRRHPDRTFSCSYCGSTDGHNRATCPTRLSEDGKARAENFTNNPLTK